MIPAIVSGLQLVVEIFSGELSRTHLGVLIASFLLAAYLQFLGSSFGLSITGVVIQVLLAIYLRIRAILSEHSV